MADVVTKLELKRLSCLIQSWLDPVRLFPSFWLVSFLTEEELADLKSANRN